MGQRSKETGSRSALLALAVLALAQLGTSADNGTFSVATADMIGKLSASVADIQLASTVYSLMAGALMLASGLAGSLVGWRRTCRLGLGVVLVGEVLTAVAPNAAVLIWCGRLAVGLGASLVIPSVLAMVSQLFEGKARIQAYGVIAGSAALATLTPILSGWIVDEFGFRVAFAGQAVFFLALFCASAALPKTPVLAAGGRIDWLGAGVTSTGLLLVLCGLSRLSSWGVWRPLAGAPAVAGVSLAPVLIVIGLVILAVLVPIERRVEARGGTAVLPPSFMRSPQLRSGVIAIALPFFYMGAQGLVTTSYLQLVLGLTARDTGLLGIISGVPMLLGAMMIPRRWPGAPAWRVVRGGYLLIALGCALQVWGMLSSTLAPQMLLGTFTGGMGVGLVNSQANNLVAGSVPASAAQQTGGIQGAARNIGMALGTAIMGSVLLVTMNNGLSARILAADIATPVERERISEQVHTYQGDASVRAQAEADGLSVEDAEKVVVMNAVTRYEATTLAMGLVGVFSVAALATTRKDKPATA